ncbi:DNA polymerase I [Azomonas agilis]|uniref:DNA polymerase I n=2 Tax=Azomonas agilis TaxID=116849 RepID=A0A562IZ42_9GAMM|nr:DNA polymerase I [Azomonas agilis]
MLMVSLNPLFGLVSFILDLPLSKRLILFIMHTTPLVLVDGSSYLYRAFHALPPLSTSSGQPTGAVRGVMNMLLALRRQYPESPFAVVFDAKGPTFRDALFEGYKSHRPPMPDDLRAQIEPLHACVRAQGWPLLCVEGVEADDVIGTLARRHADAGQPVVISTGDKDMAQLVCPKVTLVNTMTNSTLDIEGVQAKFGVGPELIIDYLALMGDSSDNIPGVPGVGEKTATALLNGIHGGLQGLYKHLDQVADLPIRGAKSLGAKLAEHKEAAFLSYQLATIKTDVALEISPEALIPAPVDKAALIELYRQLEFKNWLKELLNSTETPAQPSTEQPTLELETAPAQTNSARYHTLLTQAEFEDWLQRLQQAPCFAFDTETTGLDAQQAELVGVSFAVQAGEAAYVPLSHRYMGAPDQLDLEHVLAALKPLLEDPKQAKIVQHGKYDMNVLWRYGIQMQGIQFDTMLESYVLNATATQHNMDSMALKFLGHTTIAFEDIAGKGSKQLTFDQIALEQAGPYAAEDADITLQLHQHLWPQLEATPALTKLFTELEMPLVPVLARMERTGAYIDTALLKQHSHELGLKLLELEAQAHELAGEPFNLASPKQLGTILYEKLGYPVLAKTPKGQPSTAENVLSDLADQGCELPRVLMQYRELSKLKNTYTDRLPEQINPKTGRVHTRYHQAVTATGRLSSSDPNLQNIPIRTAEGRRIRQAFIAPQGYRIVSADYSQIELRIMAHLAEDEGLLRAFRDGLDVHRATAAEVFGVALEEVSSEQRRRAKAINFGLIYGMSAFGLAKQIDVSRTEAQDYIDRYFARYPGVLRYMEQTRLQAAEQGYVETLFGRRLYLPEIQARNPNQRKAAERTAINAPMQGTAADIIKRAMLAVDQWLHSSGLDARLILQVHDELVLEVREDLAEQVQQELAERMAHAAELRVPLVVETGCGLNWDQAH